MNIHSEKKLFEVIFILPKNKKTPEIMKKFYLFWGMKTPSLDGNENN